MIRSACPLRRGLAGRPGGGDGPHPAGRQPRGLRHHPGRTPETPPPTCLA
ncbi:hypothetical protein ACRAWD_20290 [Caulobacter segnis]